MRGDPTTEDWGGSWVGPEACPGSEPGAAPGTCAAPGDCAGLERRAELEAWGGTARVGSERAAGSAT
jgi:hypothetical protein